MSWRDYLTDDEKNELEQIEAAKKQAIAVYKEAYKKLNMRGAMRMRRDPNRGSNNE